MITFISYIPGARGKFVAELCQLSMTTGEVYGNPTSAGGNITWINFIQHDLEKLGIQWTDVHHLDPEHEKYKFYIDSISSCLSKFENNNFFVDTHYILKDTLEYALSQGHKVIRIVVSNHKQYEQINNHFFYKNFVSTLSDDQKRLDLAKRIVEQSEHGPYRLKLNLVRDQFDLPLNRWNIEALTILYKLCGEFFKIQKPNIITHENLLEVDYDSLLNFENVNRIINFVGGELNDHVKKRFDTYVAEQNKIPPFDVYINEFTKC